MQIYLSDKVSFFKTIPQRCYQVRAILVSIFVKGLEDTQRQAATAHPVVMWSIKCLNVYDERSEELHP